MKLFYLLLAALPLSMACSCLEPTCPETQPAKCRCENKFQISCSKACGTKPFLQNCKKIRPSPTSTPTPSPTSTFVPQICGSRGLPPCPSDRPACLNTPEQLADGCTTAADCPGFCVSLEGQFCGGFAGFRCPVGQTCVDDPRDDCGPPTGADCGGVCVNFPGGEPGGNAGEVA